MGRFIKSHKYVRLPIQLYNYIDELSKKTNQDMWRIIFNSVALYRVYITNKYKFMRIQTKIDKAVWYILKLSFSIYSFREKPSEKYSETIAIVEQIEKSLNIDLSLLKKSIFDMYMNKDENTETKIEITNALKIAIYDIIEKVICS